MRTYLPKKDEVKREWWLIDAEGQTLGRLASRIALILQGKRKRIYTPHIDTGDFVVVINAEKVRLTGKKLDQKIYYRHSGYPGGLHARTARQLLQTFPERLIELAVKRMLPKNKLGRRMFKRLKVYRGPEHPHKAQNPKPFDISAFN
ncbi:MAG: 50S ribosomal protein L13 [Candidatus Hydrothermota bacterium]|nr:MAG: 50S ribosomal protein L13 [Candidatus Hydrothermae bacterium]